MNNTIENGFKYDLASIEALIKSSYVLSNKKNIKTRNLWISKIDQRRIEEFKMYSKPMHVLWCGSAEDMRELDADNYFIVGFTLNIANKEALVSYLNTKPKYNTCSEELDILAEGVFTEHWKYDLHNEDDEIVDLVQGQGDIGREGVLIPTEGEEPLFGFLFDHLIPKHKHIKIFDSFPFGEVNHWELYEINKQWRDHHYAGFRPEDGVNVKMLISQDRGANEYLFLLIEEELKDRQRVIHARRRSLYMYKLVSEDEHVYSKTLLTMEDGEFDFAKFISTCAGKIVIEEVLPGYYHPMYPKWTEVRKTFISDLNIFEEVEVFKKINCIVGDPDHIRETYNTPKPDLEDGDLPSKKFGNELNALDFFKRHQDKYLEFTSGLIHSMTFNGGKAVIQLNTPMFPELDSREKWFVFEEDLEEFSVFAGGLGEVNDDGVECRSDMSMECRFIAKAVSKADGKIININLRAYGNVSFRTIVKRDFSKQEPRRQEDDQVIPGKITVVDKPIG